MTIMQFISTDPKYQVGGLGGGRVVVQTQDNVVRGEEGVIVQLDTMGHCPDSAFDAFKGRPYMLVIKDANGKNVFQIGMDGQ